MPSLRLITPLASAAVALALAIGGGLASDADARFTTKEPAPTLKISERLCNIGAEEDDRFLKFDVASGPADSEAVRAAFRIRLQSRPTAKDSWVKAPTTPSETEVGGWEIATKPNTIVAATKSLGPLAEGVQYRALVDSRGYSVKGKPATKMATRIISCTQPLFTGTLRLGKVADTFASGQHTIDAVVRNAGRLASAAGTVTVFDAVTRETLGTAPVSALKGGERADIDVSIPSCPGQVYVKVQPDGADPEELEAEQYVTIDCKGSQARRRQAS